MQSDAFVECGYGVGVDGLDLTSAVADDEMYRQIELPAQLVVFVKVASIPHLFFNIKFCYSKDVACSHCEALLVGSPGGEVVCPVEPGVALPDFCLGKYLQAVFLIVVYPPGGVVNGRCQLVCVAAVDGSCNEGEPLGRCVDE